MRIITVNLTVEMIREIATLTGKDGIYPSRSELVRVALREYLLQELKAAKQFAKFQAELQNISSMEKPIVLDHISIDEIVEIPNFDEIEEKEEPLGSEIEYKTEFQRNFQRMPTLQPPTLEQVGRVVDLGNKKLAIDGKVVTLK